MSFDRSSFGGGSGGEDAELKEFLAVEGQKAKFQNQVHMFTDVCWDRCVDKPGNKLDSKTETCLVNCVERFIDSTLAMTNRFQQLLNKQAGH
ncbi:mitochondrial import inner membrane translocase subunit Tim8 A-like [Acanthaster planci]|uniref:Mitochondrial import inner membrane translocase subunit n=1 Tax=Acanthaster planci TaxID=133434 RepID=A0A8B7XWX0_ACAPL|nr:mitochondrial import inner membrane translocase subunit Tim8 A-like [Acanthaster planci]